ncbi:MAG: acyl-CoA dehydrogenase domain-containing protein, partial [Pseudomonadota bacterium]
YHNNDWFSEAVEKGVLTDAEAADLRELEALTAKVIAVDHFDPDEVRPNYMTPGHNIRDAKPMAAPAEAAE